MIWSLDIIHDQWFNHHDIIYEAFNSTWPGVLFLFRHKIFLGFFQGLVGIVEIRFHKRFGIHLALEFVFLFYAVIDKTGDQKAGKIDKAFDFVGHDFKIWEY